jgi:hypothetical protein
MKKMQQSVVELSISIHKLHSSVFYLSPPDAPIMRCSFLLYVIEENVVTDKFLISGEAVRVLDQPLR